MYRPPVGTCPVATADSKSVGELTARLICRDMPTAGTESNSSGSACHSPRAVLGHGKSLPTSGSVFGLHKVDSDRRAYLEPGSRSHARCINSDFFTMRLHLPVLVYPTRTQDVVASVAGGMPPTRHLRRHNSVEHNASQSGRDHPEHGDGGPRFSAVGSRPFVLVNPFKGARL